MSETCKECKVLRAENKRLKAELDALKPGIPIKGVVVGDKIEWTGVDPPAEKD
jgi:hypothetical protein